MPPDHVAIAMLDIPVSRGNHRLLLLHALLKCYSSFFWTLKASALSAGNFDTLIDLHILAGNFRAVRYDLTKLVRPSNQKVRPKTAFTTYASNDRSSAKGEALILVKEGLNAVPFHLTPSGLVFDQLKTSLSSNRAFFRSIEHCSYCLDSAQLKREQNKMYHNRRFSQNFKM